MDIKTFPECHCAHSFAAHTHNRRGTECAFCMCPAYKRVIRFLREWKTYPEREARRVVG